MADEPLFRADDCVDAAVRDLNAALSDVEETIQVSGDATTAAGAAASEPKRHRNADKKKKKQKKSTDEDVPPDADVLYSGEDGRKMLDATHEILPTVRENYAAEQSHLFTTAGAVSVAAESTNRGVVGTVFVSMCLAVFFSLVSSNFLRVMRHEDGISLVLCKLTTIAPMLRRIIAANNVVYFIVFPGADYTNKDVAVQKPQPVLKWCRDKTETVNRPALTNNLASLVETCLSPYELFTDAGAKSFAQALSGTNISRVWDQIAAMGSGSVSAAVAEAAARHHCPEIVEGIDACLKEDSDLSSSYVDAVVFINIPEKVFSWEGISEEVDTVLNCIMLTIPHPILKDVRLCAVSVRTLVQVEVARVLGLMPILFPRNTQVLSPAELVDLADTTNKNVGEALVKHSVVKDKEGTVVGESAAREFVSEITTEAAASAPVE